MRFVQFEVLVRIKNSKKLSSLPEVEHQFTKMVYDPNDVVSLTKCGKYCEIKNQNAKRRSIHNTREFLKKFGIFFF